MPFSIILLIGKMKRENKNHFFKLDLTYILFLFHSLDFFDHNFTRFTIPQKLIKDRYTPFRFLQ